MTRKRPYKKQKYEQELIYDSNIKIIEELKEVFIPDYGIVKINNLGTKVYTKTGKFPSLFRDEFGYLSFNVGTTQGSRDSVKYHTLRIHRLVAMAFIPNPDNLPEVNHKDGNKLNNCITNLEWCTGQDNIRHAWNNGLMKGQNGELNGRAKLKEEDVIQIREKYKTGNITIAELAREFNVSWGLVKAIVTNKIWKEII